MCKNLKNSTAAVKNSDNNEITKTLENSSTHTNQGNGQIFWKIPETDVKRVLIIFPGYIEVVFTETKIFSFELHIKKCSSKSYVILKNLVDVNFFEKQC